MFIDWCNSWSVLYQRFCFILLILIISCYVNFLLCKIVRKEIKYHLKQKICGIKGGGGTASKRDPPPPPPGWSVPSQKTILWIKLFWLACYSQLLTNVVSFGHSCLYIYFKQKQSSSTTKNILITVNSFQHQYYHGANPNGTIINHV